MTKRKPREPVPPVDVVISHLVALQRRRAFLLKRRLQLENGMRSFVAAHFQFGEAPKKEAFARADQIIKAVRKGVAPARDADIAASCAEMIMADAAARAPMDEQEKQITRAMESLAKHLPVYQWTRGVNGVAELALAKLVGEAGDVSRFDSVAKLWSRMGVGIRGEKRQGSPGAHATNDDWARHGYNPRRHSEAWNIGNTLLICQWRGEDEKAGTPAHAIGPYGEIYARYKADIAAKNAAGEYAERAASESARARTKDSGPAAESIAGRLTPKHIDNRARRYVLKRFLADFWEAWRRTTVSEANESPCVAKRPTIEHALPKESVSVATISSPRDLVAA